jgi:hypothetical protein
MAAKSGKSPHRLPLPPSNSDKFPKPHKSTPRMNMKRKEGKFHLMRDGVVGRKWQWLLCVERVGSLVLPPFLFTRYRLVYF